MATGESGPKEGLIRFALAPDGTVAPDLAERLPGRGVWVTARRETLEKAIRRKLFARGFKAQATPPADLVSLVEAGLAQRLLDAVSLARKAGLAICGFEKVRARLRAGPAAVLLEASDGSEQGRAKLRPLAGDAPRVATLSAAELGLAFGRDFVIHGALDAGGAADRVLRESRRLAGFRSERTGEARAADDDAIGRDGAI